MVELIQYFLGGLVVGSIYGLVGVGYTGVYNVTRIVNFAQGDFAMLGAMGAIAFFELGLPLPLAIAAGVVGVGLISVAVERWTIRPARADEVRGIIITLGVGVFLQGLAVKRPVIERFVTAYEKRYGKKPATFAGNGYDSVMILAAALRKAGPVREKIRDAIEALKGHVGVTAVYSYSPTDHFGAHEDSVVMLRIRGGGFELVR